ncbi:MAG: DUF4445 domain-containing protein [Clostridiales bacterium]|nr:DUF4445 domain-containing protein [Clostridiales bacterium]
MKLILKNITNEKTVLQAINELDVDFTAPCGGNKTCGKCLIKVITPIDEPKYEEKKALGSNYEKGYRLACYIKPFDNMEIKIPDKAKKTQIMISSNVSLKTVKSDITVAQKKIKKPDLHNQFSDIESINENFDHNDLELVKSISQCVRKTDYNPTLITLDDRIVGICQKNYKTPYGIAIDIGTTTVAAYLYQLNTGNKVAVISQLNAQKKYGADVISRIEFSYSTEDGLANLHKTIIKQINNLIVQLCDRNAITCDEIFYISAVGNTTMLHFLLKLDPENIGRAPFIPITTALHKIKASELGIIINKYGYIAVLPSVASYIGSDITAGIIATNMIHKNKISLLLDIGTNGEIVLGNKKRMISCSTAAGPAFEGANIRFGTGGISGAIDTFDIVNNELVMTTIDNKAPIGICGSGIVMILAALLKNDIVDETGRFYDEDELDVHPNLASKITTFDNMVAFEVCKGIYITQKDIREIQNAKASFAAGVLTLIKRYEISIDDIDFLYLAGGFGNYIDVDSAVTIGLIPKELRKKVIPSGNTAGTGAILCMLSSSKMKKIEKISKEIEYIELSSDPSFTDQYIECMMFE